MVIYHCENCNKEFNRKSNYERHINRKNPCKKVEKMEISKPQNGQKKLPKKMGICPKKKGKKNMKKTSRYSLVLFVKKSSKGNII